MSGGNIVDLTVFATGHDLEVKTGNGYGYGEIGIEQTMEIKQLHVHGLKRYHLCP